MFAPYTKMAFFSSSNMGRGTKKVPTEKLCNFFRAISLNCFRGVFYFCGTLKNIFFSNYSKGTVIHFSKAFLNPNTDIEDLQILIHPKQNGDLSNFQNFGIQILVIFLFSKISHSSFHIPILVFHEEHNGVIFSFFNFL